MIADGIQFLTDVAVKETSVGRVILKAVKLSFLAGVAILSLIPVSAQQSKGVPPAPVLLQIVAAQKVFISNAGGESFESVIDETVFNGGPDRPYNQFYASMKNWGRYQLVSSPTNADLVVEISWVLTDTGLKTPSSRAVSIDSHRSQDACHSVESYRICAGSDPAGQPRQELRSSDDNHCEPHEDFRQPSRGPDGCAQEIDS